VLSLERNCWGIWWSFRVWS